MIRKELQRLIGMTPFEPFVIKLSNGAAFEIHDPQMIALHPRTAHVANQDQSWIIIQYVTICSVESIFPDYQGTLGEYESRRDR